MYSIIRYILLTASRDLLFAGLFVLLLMAIGVSFFLGSSALIEQQQMVIAYVAGATRIILITGLVVFICFHIKRAFDTKEIEVMLSRPISRPAFLLAYWMGFSTLGIASVLILMIVIGALLSLPMLPLLYWGFSLLLEVMLMVAFAVLSALLLQSAVASVLFCFGFYIMARMMGFFILAVDNMPHSFTGGIGNMVTAAMERMLKLVAMVFPRLDFYGKSEWLIYGIPKDHTWIFVGQSVAYIAFLLAIAVFDFRRKQF